MSGAEVATIIGGITGFLATMYGTWRVARADRLKNNADSAAVLLGGWAAFQAETKATMTAEVERVKKSCQDEIDALREEHEEDRQEWRRRERAMREEIDSLKREIAELRAAGRENIRRHEARDRAEEDRRANGGDTT